MLILNNVTTTNAYTKDLTLGPVPKAEKIIYLVANNPVIAQLAPHSNDNTEQPWGPEILITPQSAEFQRVQGARFRSAIPGAPAQVIAILVEPQDALPVGGNPFTATLATNGAVSPVASSALVQIGDVIVGAGGASFIEFSPIPQTYNELELEILARSSDAGVVGDVMLQINSDGGANYDSLFGDDQAAARTVTERLAQVSATIGLWGGQGAAAGGWGVTRLKIPQPAAANREVMMTYEAYAKWSTAAGSSKSRQGAASWRNTTAVTTLRAVLSAGNFVQNSRATLWGQL